jgi:hypothetical protein
MERRSAHGLRLDFRRFIFGRAASSAGRSGRSSRRGRGRAVPAGCGPQDTARLADTVAEKTQTELFNVNRSLFRLTEGRLIAVNKDVLRDIIARHIVSLRLVNRASTKRRHRSGQTRDLPASDAIPLHVMWPMRQLALPSDSNRATSPSTSR